MSKKSAGILLYRMINKTLEVLLVHPGGPFFAKKDLGSWSIPKGEYLEEEDPLEAAKREFLEETGFALHGEYTALAPVKQKSGKVVYAWAIEGNIDEKKIKSNLFQIEWPPKSGKLKEYPEIDRAEWFDISSAKQKINPAQVELLFELTIKLHLL